MKRFKKFISLFLTMVMLLSVCSIGITVSATDIGTNTTEETPLKIEIETDTKNPSVYSVVGFTVKITNTGDEDLTNVTAQTVFDDLSPVNNRKSEITKEVETLKAGESFSYSYRATLNMSNPDLHFFNRFILWFVRLFSGGYTVENTNIDDGRIVVENITEFSFGGVTAENIVVLRYKRAEIEIEQAEMTDSQKELLKIAELNGGTLPDISKSTSTGVPTFIDGKYSDKIVTDYKSAIDSLNDIKHLMNIDNPDSEFVLQQERKTSNGKNQYKLQQVYNTIPVYGSELTITVDNNGNVDCLNGQYNPQIRERDISTSPRISKSEVENGLEKQEYSVVSNKGLIIYATEGYKPQLVYEVKCSGMITLFISAEDGHIVSSESSQRTFSASGNDMYGENRSFEVLKKNDNLYMLIDETRGITVYNNNNKTTEDEKNSFTKHTEYLTHCEIITSQNNTWNDESVQAMYAVQKCVDFYKNTVKTTAFDNQLSKINVAINYMSGYFNAFSDTDLYNSATYLCIGDGIEFLKGYDVIAHEFTHSIISATCNFKYVNQSGALDEAYADILGNIIEGGDDWTIGEDITGIKPRSLEKPNDYNLPSKVNDKYMADYCYEDHNHYKANCDKGGVHTNCSIVSHAAYLMWKNGITDKVRLAQLFVTSLEYMNSTSNFLDCRAAVLKSAKELNMSAEEINIIKEAFSEVGIGEDNDGFSWITGTVKGKLININTGEPVVDTRIFACTKEGYNGAIVGGGYFYPDENGDFSAQLYGGIYTFFISPQNDIDNKSNYDEYCIKEIKVKSWKTNDLGTIFLIPKNTNDDTNDDSGNSGDNFDDETNTYKSISFTVTDEVTDKPIENVTVEVTKHSESLTNVIATATTDKNGRFTVELPEGEYSFLLTHDDYYQSFVPITVNSETADGIMYLSPMDNTDDEDIDFSGYVHSGGYTTSFVDAKGNLFICGSNSSGQLGNSDEDYKTSYVLMMSDVKMVHGSSSLAAITKYNQLYTWGYNGYNQLGYDCYNSIIPTKIENGVKDVCITSSTCAYVTENGNMYVMGNPRVSFGDLNNTKESSIPIKVLENIIDIELSTNEDYGLTFAAINKNNELYMWGNNEFSIIIPNSTENVEQPTKVMENVKSVSIGKNYVLALTTNNELYAWGCNYSGQLGNGNTISISEKIKIMDNVILVDTGSDTSLAINSEGELFTWGANSHGCLGQGINPNKDDRNVFLPTKIMDNVKCASIDRSTMIILDKNGNIYTCGWNKSGQLGTGDIKDRYSPTLVYNIYNS